MGSQLNAFYPYLSDRKLLKLSVEQAVKGLRSFRTFRVERSSLIVSGSESVV